MLLYATSSDLYQPCNLSSISHDARYAVSRTMYSRDAISARDTPFGAHCRTTDLFTYREAYRLLSSPLCDMNRGGATRATSYVACKAESDYSVVREQCAAKSDTSDPRVALSRPACALGKVVLRASCQGLPVAKLLGKV